jgi:hypothetical protein
VAARQSGSQQLYHAGIALLKPIKPETLIARHLIKALTVVTLFVFSVASRLEDENGYFYSLSKDK